MLKVSKIDSACRKTVFHVVLAGRGALEISYVDIVCVCGTVTLRDRVSRSGVSRSVGQSGKKHWPVRQETLASQAFGCNDAL